MQRCSRGIEGAADTPPAAVVPRSQRSMVRQERPGERMPVRLTALSTGEGRKEK